MRESCGPSQIRSGRNSNVAAIDGFAESKSNSASRATAVRCVLLNSHARAAPDRKPQIRNLKANRKAPTSPSAHLRMGDRDVQRVVHELPRSGARQPAAPRLGPRDDVLDVHVLGGGDRTAGVRRDPAVPLHMAHIEFGVVVGSFRTVLAGRRILGRVGTPVRAHVGEPFGLERGVKGSKRKRDRGRAQSPDSRSRGAAPGGTGRARRAEAPP